MELLTVHTIISHAQEISNNKAQLYYIPLKNNKNTLKHQLRYKIECNLKTLVHNSPPGLRPPR